MIGFASFPVNEKILTPNYNYQSNNTISPTNNAPMWQGVVSLSCVFISMFIASTTGIPTLLFSSFAIIFGILGLSKKFNFFNDNWLNILSIAGLALGALVFITSLPHIGNW